MIIPKEKYSYPQCQVKPLSSRSTWRDPCDECLVLEMQICPLDAEWFLCHEAALDCYKDPTDYYGCRGDGCKDVSSWLSTHCKICIMRVRTNEDRCGSMFMKKIDLNN
ncbi:hypothetical protein PV325_005164 [Microctonus aethiopoides]|nr:hypothetical protein PV325_005164 [Microctonus aethiopoides]KAK0086484.1 hypothetical protein PV326_005532 [Microctonus aethiopoides]